MEDALPDLHTTRLLQAFPDAADPSLANILYLKHAIAVIDRQADRDLRAFHGRRVNDLVKHAVSHSPWWRARIPHGASSFTDLPLMTRRDLRDFIENADGPLTLPPNHGTTTSGSTTGSSGTPAKFFNSQLAGTVNQAYYWLDRERNGIGEEGLIARFSVHIDDLPAGDRLVPAQPHLMRAAEIHRKPQQFTIEEHARWLARVKPTDLLAHPPIVVGMMDAFDAGVAQPPPLRFILSYADTLPPDFRERARKLFGARVLDRYSCQELGPIAFQCPRDDTHFHLAHANVIVEFLDESGKAVPAGEPGRVHVTGLNNFATPFVRYELGDLATWTLGCRCGYRGKVISRLHGRERFLAKLPSGERQYVNFGARHWLRVIPVTEARLIQRREGEFTAEFVLDRPITEEERLRLVDELRSEISEAFHYEIVQVERIEWGPTYKRQDVISLV